MHLISSTAYCMSACHQIVIALRCSYSQGNVHHVVGSFPAWPMQKQILAHTSSVGGTSAALTPIVTASGTNSGDRLTLQAMSCSTAWLYELIANRHTLGPGLLTCVLIICKVALAQINCQHTPWRKQEKKHET